MSKMCSSQEVLEIVGAGKDVFVLFYADWCPFSRAFLPVFEKHTKGRDKEFVRIVLDGNEELFDSQEIEVYPTVLFFQGGRLHRRLDGTHFLGLKEKQLTAFISSCEKDRARS